MIGAGPPYVTLMASLPALGPLLAAQAPAINANRLQRRLRLLLPEDRAQIEALRRLLAWNALDLREADASFVARAGRTLAGLANERLRRAARDRLEIRTAVAALRRRHAGEAAPPPGEAWGFGRFVAAIRANWTAPDFTLGTALPWLGPARERLEAGDRRGLEQIILTAAWAAGNRHLAGHDFDLEAVALYLLRWSLVERWSRYDADGASIRFAELLDQALATAPAGWTDS